MLCCRLLLATVLVTAIISAQVKAQTRFRDTIQIAGSSTMLPFVSIAAEEFGYSFAQFRVPVVGSGGSAGGLRQFCQGVGSHTIDIANTSRPMRPAELAACKANGVEQILEVTLGYDAIVFASRIDAAAFNLTPRQIFLAQAAQVPSAQGMVANPYKRWSDIDTSLPEQQIVLAIPGTNHGTREIYEEDIILPGCLAMPAVQQLESQAQLNFCSAIRKDGRVIEIAGDYTETLARLDAQHDAVGVFGVSFYQANRDRIKVAAISGVLPAMESILAGEYPLTRPLYFYVKLAHVGLTPGLLEFSRYLASDTVSGEDSPLQDAGLIPLVPEQRQKMLQRIITQQSL